MMTSIIGFGDPITSINCSSVIPLLYDQSFCMSYLEIFPLTKIGAFPLFSIPATTTKKEISKFSLMILFFFIRKKNLLMKSHMAYTMNISISNWIILCRKLIVNMLLTDSELVAVFLISTAFFNVNTSFPNIGEL